MEDKLQEMKTCVLSTDEKNDVVFEAIRSFIPAHEQQKVKDIRTKQRF